MTNEVATGASSTQASADPFALKRRRWVIVGLLTLGMVIAYVDRSNISVALAVPEFKEAFGLSNADRGLLNSAFFWSYALLQIPAGWIVDRFGVRWPYAIGFVIWSLTSAATAFAGSVSQLFSLRCILGLGESIVGPASMGWIRFNFPEERRGLAIGIYLTGTKIGPAVGIPIAAYLTHAYSWKIMFVVLGVGCLLWLVPWLALVNDTPRSQASVKPQTKQAVHVTFVEILASPAIWGVLIGTFCYMYFVYFCLTWMPAYLVERRNLTLTSMGLYTFASFGGMALTAAAAGWAADHMIGRGANPVRVRKGFTIAGFALASTEVFGALSDSPRVALFFAVFSLTGLGLATANYWALTQTLVPGTAIGRIVGIQNCAANIPGIVAPLLTGWLVGATGNYSAPMRLVWVFLTLGICAYVFLVREKYAPRSRKNLAHAGAP